MVTGSFYGEYSGPLSFGWGTTLSGSGIYLAGGLVEFGSNSTIMADSELVVTGQGLALDNQSLVEADRIYLGPSAAIEAESQFELDANEILTNGPDAEISAGKEAWIEADQIFLSGALAVVGPNSNEIFRETYVSDAAHVGIATESSLETNKIYLNEASIGGAGVLITDYLGWGSGTMGGSGTTLVEGDGNIGLNGTKVEGEVEVPIPGLGRLVERTLINEGTVRQNVGALTMIDGAELVNKGEYLANSETKAFGAQIKVGSPSTSEPRIVNAARAHFEKKSGSGNTTVTPRFVNQGVVHAKAGDLSIKTPVKAPPFELLWGVPDWVTKRKIPKRDECGDPVDCATGNFTEQQTDFMVPVRGIPLEVTRSYNAIGAADATEPGIFGYGWTGAFTDHLEVHAEAVELVSASGGRVVFDEVGGQYVAPPWVTAELSNVEGGGFELRGSDTRIGHFSATGLLTCVEDLYGNETIVTHNEAGQLTKITDPAGRSITLSYNEAGLVETAEDPVGHLVTYGYEGHELVSVSMLDSVEPRWEYEYDGQHRIVKETNAEGGDTINEYDEENRVIRQTDPAGRELEFEYAGFHTRIQNVGTNATTDHWFTSSNLPAVVAYAYGQPEEITETLIYDDDDILAERRDGVGNTNKYAYDEDGHLVFEELPEGETATWSYGGDDFVDSSTDAAGKNATFVRNPAGQTTEVKIVGQGGTSETQSFSYDSAGNMTELTDPAGGTRTYDYDGAGNKIAEHTPMGETRTWQYNELSQLVGAVDPRGNLEGAEPDDFKTVLTLDVYGQTTAQADALGNTTDYTYDKLGRLVEEEKPGGAITSFEYDGDGDILLIDKPEGNSVERSYDEGGHLIEQTGGQEGTVSFEYNGAGERIAEVDGLGEKLASTYGPAGELVSKSDQLGRVTNYSYDGNQRLGEISYSDEATPDVTFEYDAYGDLARMTDGTGTTSYDYDGLSRVTKVTNGASSVVEYEYDAFGNITGLTYPNGEVVTQSYDANGRLASITDWLGHVISYDYTAAAQIEKVSFSGPGEQVDSFVYDRVGRVEGAEFTAGEALNGMIHYEWNIDSHLVEETTAGLAGAAHKKYGYDFMGRVVEDNAGSFEYDPDGNMVSTPLGGRALDAAGGVGEIGESMFEYNAVGERTKEEATGAPAIYYAYSQNGTLVSADQAPGGESLGFSESFVYDGTGLMASRTSSTGSHQLSWNVDAENPRLLADGERFYLYGPEGEPVAEIEGASARYLHTDNLGSVRLQTLSSGAVSGAASYGTFGELEASTGTGPSMVGYAGQYDLPDSGLRYSLARVYDPKTAQFLSRDREVETTAAPYSYANDSPSTFIDPSGFTCIAAHGLPSPASPFGFSLELGFGECPSEIAGAVTSRESLKIWSLVAGAVALGACSFGGIPACVGASVNSFIIDSAVLVGEATSNKCFDFVGAEVATAVLGLLVPLHGAAVEKILGKSALRSAPKPIRRIIKVFLNGPHEVPDLIYRLKHGR